MDKEKKIVKKLHGLTFKISTPVLATYLSVYHRMVVKVFIALDLGFTF